MLLALNYSFRSVWVRRRTSITTVAGIALVVFVLACSQMLASGLRDTLRVSGRSDRAIVLQQGAFAEPNSRLSQTILNYAATAPGVHQGAEGGPLVTGESVVQLSLASEADARRLVTVFLRGVSANVFQLRPQVRIVRGRVPQPGTDEAVVGKNLVGRFQGLALGGRIELKPNRPIRIVGVFEADGSAYESEVWADIESVRTSLAWEGYLSSVTVQLASANQFEDFAADVRAKSQGAAIAERETDYYSRISRGLASVIAGLGGIVALIFSVAAVLGAAITMYSSVGQRKREIGTFRALGFRPWHILMAICCEASALAFAGAGFGVSLALLVTLTQFSMVNAATGAELAFRFQPTLPTLVSSVFAGAIVGLLGGLFPGLQAAYTSPIDALRS